MAKFHVLSCTVAVTVDHDHQAAGQQRKRSKHTPFRYVQDQAEFVDHYTAAYLHCYCIPITMQRFVRIKDAQSAALAVASFTSSTGRKQFLVEWQGYKHRNNMWDRYINLKTAPAT